MITIKDAYFKRSYRYLWLKSIVAVNIAVHCERCLIGERDYRIEHRMKEVHDLELAPAPYYYLCGVSMDFDWSKNLHVAFREKEGSVVEIDDDFIKCRIENAERIPVTDEYLDKSNIHINDPQYSTCRNWQFAHYLLATDPNIRNKVKRRSLSMQCELNLT